MPSQVLELLHTIRGYPAWINRIAWSPDGKRLATTCNDGKLRVIDAATGGISYEWVAHGEASVSVAWSPDGKRLATGGYDHKVKVWTGPAAREMRRGSGVHSVAWSPDGRELMSGWGSGNMRLFDPDTGERTVKLQAHRGNVFTIAWPGPEWVATGGDDPVVRVWSTGSWTASQLTGHSGYVLTLACHDGMLVSGSADSTIRVWDVASAKARFVLEGHRGDVRCLSFSHDGRLMASKGADGRVLIWRTDTWQTVAEYEEPASGAWLTGLAFHPSQPILASLGEGDTIVRIWKVDAAALAGSGPSVESVRRITAKVVLVGESGAGKTALGGRLFDNRFLPAPSTHGQKFWVLDDVRAKRSDGTECETVLWDLAGQPDYRIIHALFLDDADLVLVVFDAARPTEEALRGVEYWLRAVEGKAVILVAARVDASAPQFSREAIEAFCDAHRIGGGYIETSALSGAGIQALLESMQQLIPWEEMAATSTPTVFDSIKSEVLQRKAGDRRAGLLTDASHLARSIGANEPDVLAATQHLAKHGYIHLLRTTSGETAILLEPDLLNNLAASFIVEARRDPRELGAIDERKLLAGGYDFSELRNVGDEDRRTLIDAARVLFLANNICFRERLGQVSYLVFPELINLNRPRRSAVEAVDDVSYTVSGAVQNLYAALVVLLGYTDTFTRTDQWQNEAQYEVEPGEICGFRQTRQPDGSIEFVLYYSASVSDATRLQFQGLFERILRRRDVVVKAFRPHRCGRCGYLQKREEVMRRIGEGAQFMFCSNCGNRLPLEPARGTEPLADIAAQKADREGRRAQMRTRFEAALARVQRLVPAPAADSTPPLCFISYAWGAPEHERWIERRLATDLRAAGIRVLLDRWENAQIGASIPRFIERIGQTEWVVVVGTPAYRTKYQNDAAVAAVVAAEVDLINQRMLGTETEKATVLPLLLAGSEQESFPPLLMKRVYADFRDDRNYFLELFKVILTLYRVPADSPAVADLFDQLQTAPVSAAQTVGSV